MQNTAVAIVLTLASFVSLPTLSAVGDGFLSGTYLDPAMQRDDIFAHHITKAWPEYRYAYNRPRYISGHIAHMIEPTSQEAMSWLQSHKQAHYKNHAGRCVPMYYYPKPWEAINTMARPDSQVPAP